MTAKIALTEVFAAPQGEGYHSGRWAIFVRLTGCPLACEFSPGVVCDTPYMKANLKVTLDELFEDIISPLLPPLSMWNMDHAPPPRELSSRMLIITGGEPTFCPQFDDIIARALKTHCYVAVETNGVRWREGLRLVDWISVSPKDRVAQTSTARWHNQSPGTARLDHNVREELAQRVRTRDHRNEGGEYRYVISRNDSTPCYDLAHRHYVSPAVLSSGSGDEWKTGFPGYSRGAVERCLAIVRSDPRWRVSTQIHKMLGVR